MRSICLPLILAAFLLLMLCAPGMAAVKLGTHFFYWYDAASGDNVDQSKMPYHPYGLSAPYAPYNTYYSSLSVPWYEWQLKDMNTAGVDYAFPVSWGEKYQNNTFKQSNLSKLVQAIRNTNSPIKIGLYDDTQSEAAEWNADNGRGYTNSTTDARLQLSCAAPEAGWYFYNEKIKPFFQMIPRDLWATHNGLPVANGGRPLILTFTSYYYKDLSSSGALWQNVKSAFKADFGVDPFLALCWSWWYFGNVSGVADGECVYGGAMGGVNTYNINSWVCSNLGPGCDTRKIGRTDYKPRWTDADGSDDGQEDQWLRDNFHKVPSDCSLVQLESWNELWEGTAISRCTDFPRKTGGTLPETYYMDKTREQIRWLRDRISSPTSLQNGTFELSVSGIANSWTPYWVYGDVTFAVDMLTKHGGSNSQKMYTSSATHLAGLYQRASAIVGAKYTFSAWTRREDPFNNGAANEETWVGIDPAGGVDPTSPSIIWSSSQYSYKTWTQQSVSAVAASNRITVFIKARANSAGSTMRANFDDAILTLPAAQVFSILDGKAGKDDTPVSLLHAVVTAAFPGYFYVENDIRSCGVRVNLSNHGMQAGMRADVVGSMATGSDGERYIAAISAVQNGSGSVKPIAVTNKSLGGGDWPCNSTNIGQRGIANETGLNNIGLLVRITGQFNKIDNYTFTITDGSSAPVKCVVPAGVTLNTSWKHINVTGISSCETANGQLSRLLKVRSLADIAVMK